MLKLIEKKLHIKIGKKAIPLFFSWSQLRQNSCRCRPHKIQKHCILVCSYSAQMFMKHCVLGHKVNGITAQEIKHTFTGSYWSKTCTHSLLQWVQSIKPLHQRLEKECSHLWANLRTRDQEDLLWKTRALNNLKGWKIWRKTLLTGIPASVPRWRGETSAHKTYTLSRTRSAVFYLCQTS
jgi:hypothetical protein